MQVGRCSIFVIPRISAGSPANATQRDAEHRHRSLKDRYAISVRANRYWKQPIFNTPELAGLPAGRAVSAIASSACGSTRTRARPTYPAPFAPGSSPTTGQPGRLCRGDPPRRSGPRNSSRCGSMSRIKAAQSAGVCGPGYACSHRPLHDTTCHILALFFIDTEAETGVDWSNAPRMSGRASITSFPPRRACGPHLDPSEPPRLKPVNPRTPVALEQSTMITGRNM